MAGESQSTEKRLADLGQKLRNVNDERARVMREIRIAIRAADQAGVPRTRITKLLGVARQTVYDALAERE